MPWMPYKRWEEARFVFNYFAMQLPHDQHIHFDTYVGVTFPTNSCGDFMLLEKEIKRIENMLGPNAYTLFKIYVAQSSGGGTEN